MAGIDSRLHGRQRGIREQQYSRPVGPEPEPDRWHRQLRARIVCNHRFDRLGPPATTQSALGRATVSAERRLRTTVDSLVVTPLTSEEFVRREALSVSLP